MEDKDPELESWMKLGDDGKQPYVQGRCTLNCSRSRRLVDERNGRAGSLQSLRKNVGDLQRVRDEPQPSKPIDDPGAPHMPLGSLSSSKNEAIKQCRPQ